jgi:hypothetical protein
VRDLVSTVAPSSLTVRDGRAGSTDGVVVGVEVVVAAADAGIEETESLAGADQVAKDGFYPCGARSRLRWWADEVPEVQSPHGISWFIHRCGLSCTVVVLAAGSLVPGFLGNLDGGPVLVDPLVQEGEGVLEVSAEQGDSIDHGALDSVGVDMSSDESVSFGSSEGLGEDFVRDPFYGLEEFLVAAIGFGEMAEDGQRPPAAE